MYFSIWEMYDFTNYVFLVFPIQSSPSIEELKIESPSKWNSYESFNLEHCIRPFTPTRKQRKTLIHACGNIIGAISLSLRLLFWFWFLVMARAKCAPYLINKAAPSVRTRNLQPDLELGPCWSEARKAPGDGGAHPPTGRGRACPAGEGGGHTLPVQVGGWNRGKRGQCVANVGP